MEKEIYFSYNVLRMNSHQELIPYRRSNKRSFGSTNVHITKRCARVINKFAYNIQQIDRQSID